jgi:hypothetical protein
MKSAPILVAAAAVGVLTFATTRSAYALGPVDLEIGLKGGEATNPINNGGTNPMGPGIGVRGGVGIFGLYGGVKFMYYFGENSFHSTMYGIEGGYSLGVGPITIRPQVGVGNLSFSGPDDFSKSNIYIEPGVTVLVSLLGWFVGADANVLLTPGLESSQAALTINGQVGIKF